MRQSGGEGNATREGGAAQRRLESRDGPDDPPTAGRLRDSVVPSRARHVTLRRGSPLAEAAAVPGAAGEPLKAAARHSLGWHARSTAAQLCVSSSRRCSSIWSSSPTAVRAVHLTMAVDRSVSTVNRSVNSCRRLPRATTQPMSDAIRTSAGVTAPDEVIGGIAPLGAPAETLLLKAIA